MELHEEQRVGGLLQELGLPRAYRPHASAYPSLFHLTIRVCGRPRRLIGHLSVSLQCLAGGQQARQGHEMRARARRTPRRAGRPPEALGSAQARANAQETVTSVTKPRPKRGVAKVLL